ncbi:MAG: MBL fold metallo-hydrolase [Planctomycetota bacterium]
MPVFRNSDQPRGTGVNAPIPNSQPVPNSSSPDRDGPSLADNGDSPTTQASLESDDSLTAAEVVFLGTGTSVGVPALGCSCDICRSTDPKNNRTRCAIVIRRRDQTLLIDTPPDLRMQLLRESIPLVHAVVYTHEHADHLFGLDDLRLFPFRLGHAMPLFCTDVVEQRIRKSFDYAFMDRKPTHPGATPSLVFRRIDDDATFDVLGMNLVPLPLKHGPHFDVLGFRLGDFAYCTDTNFIPDSTLERLQGVRTFVVGALRMEPHPTHFNLDDAMEVAAKVGAEQTWITHVGHTLDHQKTNAYLPDGIDLAYDGLRLPIRVSIAPSAAR